MGFWENTFLTWKCHPGEPLGLNNHERRYTCPVPESSGAAATLFIPLFLFFRECVLASLIALMKPLPAYLTPPSDFCVRTQGPRWPLGFASGANWRPPWNEDTSLLSLKLLYRPLPSGTHVNSGLPQSFFMENISVSLYHDPCPPKKTHLFSLKNRPEELSRSFWRSQLP